MTYVPYNDKEPKKLLLRKLMIITGFVRRYDGGNRPVCSFGSSRVSHTPDDSR